MFRIHRLASTDRTVVRIEGRLVGRDAARLVRFELERVRWKVELALDLEDLVFADDLSLTELRIAVREGAIVHNATRLVAALLREGGS